MSSRAALPRASSRPRVRVPVAGLAEGERALGAQAARYLATVHRLSPGDPFEAFDPARGVEADGEVVAQTAGDLVARFGALRAAKLVATREVTWIQALPKGEKMDGIVRDATELGVTRVAPALSAFTVVKLDGPRREARRQRWERIAREAARQCGRSDAPEILPVVSWQEAIEASGPSHGAAFCLYERATTPLRGALLEATRSSESLVFAAGPEGGLAADEVTIAERSGFQALSLGPYILRAETVAAATLGALRVLEGVG